MSREAGWAPKLLPSRGGVSSWKSPGSTFGNGRWADASHQSKWGRPMTPIKSKPLIHQEIEELDAFLLSDDGPENVMDVSGLDGFLCAVLSVANFIMPSG